VLCLPDEASREAASWAEGAKTRLIDASTAHRVAEGWTFGLPELTAVQRAEIRAAKRVANPGCYASSFILLTRPLVDAGALAAESTLSVHAVSGYTGGGRTMIERWEDPAAGLIGLPFEAPYALERRHKHIPEMVRYSRLTNEPQFVPAVGPFRCGMRVEIPLPAGTLRPGFDGEGIHAVLRQRYADERFVRVAPMAAEIDDFSLDPRACNDTNRIELHVLPHPSGHVLLVAILDNLGKGAAGVAIQNLNLMLGLAEDAGLRA
jgi:N-acetyl-gamma-glutamyl-phosphate reductase